MPLAYPLGKPKADTDVLWRAEAKRYSCIIDANIEKYGITDPELQLLWYAVTKRTPKGAWIGDRFVRLTARKRFADETQDEAIESFRARKQKQIKILEAQLHRAKQDLALCPTPALTPHSARSPSTSTTAT